LTRKGVLTVAKANKTNFFSRYTVYFTNKQDSDIRRYAKERDTDMSATIRELVALGLKVAEKRRQRLIERKAELERVMGL